MQPEQLAVRTINQYRRRDILPYVGLRYYFDATSATRDSWAKQVSTHLVTSNQEPNYLPLYHFKDRNEDMKFEHREMHFPSPNEAFCEAYFIQECSKYPHAFNCVPHVYSYRFPDASSKEGIFQMYLGGYRKRHHDVATACRASDDLVVHYTDIKRFYPSITHEALLSAWVETSSSAQLDEGLRKTGHALLHRHVAAAIGTNSKAILTGPMFSHLMGNLVLRNIDATMHHATAGRYYRYVDDIILIGTTEEVRDARILLGQLLTDLGLQLHEGEKDFQIPAAIWLEGAADFDDDGTIPNWMTFISDLKRFLLTEPPAKQAELQILFIEREFRIPFARYAGDAREKTYLERLREITRLVVQNRKMDTSDLIATAESLRRTYTDKIISLLAHISDEEGYSRKRKISKLRLLAGRLIYLADFKSLEKLIPQLLEVRELCVLGEVSRTLLSRNASTLVSMGTNAVQAAAQVLRLTNEPVKCQPDAWGGIELQGLSVLLLNGITIDSDVKSVIGNNELGQFASADRIGLDLMKSSHKYIQNLACLHGIDTRRHESVLDTAFSADELLAFDVISQLKQSS